MVGPTRVNMLIGRTLDVVDDYWARDLGCARDQLRSPVPRVQAHAGGLEGYAGVFVLTVDPGAPVVSAPAELARTLAPRAPRFTADAVSEPDVLRRLLEPVAVGPVIGPAYLSYADAGSFRAPDLGNTRQLGVADRREFDAFRSRCDPADWDPKGFDLESKPTFGAFGERGDLLAVADFELWAGRIAHLSVVAHPHARGQGHGARAVAAAAARALDAGHVLQYRALRENRASLRVAARLGFVRYGWSVAARLAAE